MEERSYLPVTVDKSHLVTIGERLYAESIELIRELVNNAYDADATEVKVTVTPDSVSVEDNGTGMDLEGLQQYFVIGSQERSSAPSRRFSSDRIGQFGIGKFATLSACQRFTVYTQKENFAARVVFDKEAWSQEVGEWRLPLEILSPDPQRANGTTVTLQGLTKQFLPEDVERKIIEGVPLKAPHFAVFLNQKPVTPKSFSGHRIPFLEGTEFGLVSGEIIILPASASSVDELGIEVKVKQVTIRRDLFGAETWGKVAARIRGEIHADFLPITSDRSGFIMDSPEYRAFIQTMQRVMNEVHAVLIRLMGKGEKRAASRALGEALERISKSLFRNPDFSPFGPIPIGEPGGIGGAAATKSLESTEPTHEGKPVGMNRTSPKLARKRPTVKRLTPDAVVRKLKMGQAGISCCLDHFGETGPESFSEGTTVYINRDHPLYKEAKRATRTPCISRGFSPRRSR